MDVDQIDFGVQIDEGSEREHEFNEYVYMKNYHLIEQSALHFVWSVNYTGLLNHVTGEFPRCFAQDFTDIEVVLVDAIVNDPDHLFWFSKSLEIIIS